MGTILILSLGNTIMKVIILLCAVVAAVTANTCQDQKNVVDKLAKEASKHYPPAPKGMEFVRMEKDLAVLEKLQVPLPLVFCKDTLMVLLSLHVCRESSVLLGTAMTASAGP